NGTRNFDRDQSATRRGCMIAGSDPVSLFEAILGDESVHHRFGAPAMAGTANRWGAKAKPPVSQMAGGLNAHREKCVMSGRNWSRLKQRSLMRRRGVEDVKGDTPIAAPLGNRQQRRQLNKAELREQ